MADKTQKPVLLTMKDIRIDSQPGDESKAMTRMYLPPCSLRKPSSAAPWAAMIANCSATLVRAITVLGV